MMSTHHKKYKLKGFSSWGKILWSSKKHFFKNSKIFFFKKLKSVPFKKFTTFWQWSWASFLKITSKSEHSLLSYPVYKFFWPQKFNLWPWPWTLTYGLKNLISAWPWPRASFLKRMSKSQQPFLSYHIHKLFLCFCIWAKISWQSNEHC